MFSGLRKADELSVTLASIQNGEITVRTSKRGQTIRAPIHPVLQRAIDSRPRSDALQISVNSLGMPWTESGFKRNLEREGLIGPGLTPHGLRHTLGPVSVKPEPTTVQSRTFSASDRPAWRATIQKAPRFPIMLATFCRGSIRRKRRTNAEESCMHGPEKVSTRREPIRLSP
jgi:integrase